MRDPSIGCQNSSLRERETLCYEELTTYALQDFKRWGYHPQSVHSKGNRWPSPLVGNVAACLWFDKRLDLCRQTPGVRSSSKNYLRNVRNHIISILEYDFRGQEQYTPFMEAKTMCKRRSGKPYALAFFYVGDSHFAHQKIYRITIIVTWFCKEMSDSQSALHYWRTENDTLTLLWPWDIQHFSQSRRDQQHDLQYARTTILPLETLFSHYPSLSRSFPTLEMQTTDHHPYNNAISDPSPFLQ